MAMLDIKDLSFKYPNADKMAICGLDLTVNEGEFVLLCGESGSGKTTLLRLIKNEIAPNGEMTGSISLLGKSVTELDGIESATKTGYVMQDPENQIVTEYVRSELAFALENLGEDKARIKRRVGEICTVFGLAGSMDKHTYELSGGQKQTLNLASVMTYSPALLLLDEPSAYLDPVSAERFFETVRRLNRENGVTVVISEHRCGRLFEYADRIAVLENGRMFTYGTKDEVVRACKGKGISGAFPAFARLWQQLELDGKCPESIPEGRAMLTNVSSTIAPVKPKTAKDFRNSKVVLSAKGVRFRYTKNGSDVLTDASDSVREGEILCLLGGNGSGKSTFLKLLAGIKKPLDGKIELFGKKLTSYGGELYRRGITFLPQNAKTAFITESVRDDLMGIALSLTADRTEAENKVNGVTRKLEIQHLTEKNPLDLSGGELQLCAVAKALLAEPRVLLLDEPEKGVDFMAKRRLAELLREIASEGTAIVAVTHDLEFASWVADTCAMVFDGELISASPCDEFFLTGEIYTTETVRLTRKIINGAVRVGDVRYE